MSLLNPNSRDHRDAHADTNEDSLYRQKICGISGIDWSFEPVHGFFKQSLEDTDDMVFNYIFESFGIERPWGEIMAQLEELNISSPPNVKYKLLFLARHGEGWHNVAFEKFGQEAWIAKWKYLGTDGEITWGPDAELTPLGVAQARENGTAWEEQLASGAPLPTKFFVSPLSRSLLTFKETWGGKPIGTPVVVVENLRETIGQHLCHKRSSKPAIFEKFPFVQFEEGFQDDDELFDSYSEQKEQLHEQFIRVNCFLQKVFNTCEDQVLSVTSHAGTIRSFITVIGHRKFTIPTGGMIPIVVKGVKK